MAEQLPFFIFVQSSCRKKEYRERERTRTLNGENRIMKIQELVYDRPNLIRSQVGSVSNFGCMLQFHIFFFLQLMWVFSPVQAKSKTEQCQYAFKYHSRARKRERECYNYVCVQLSVGLCQWIHICVHMYVLVCVCVRQGGHICVTVSMYRWGVGVNCVLVCRRPWMLSRLQLGTAMAHVQWRKQQEQATYKLNGHTLKTSSVTLASSSMSSRVMKHAVDTRIVLGCQSEQEVQGIFRLIWIFTFFQRKNFLQKKYFLIKDDGADEHTQNQQWRPHL